MRGLAAASIAGVLGLAGAQTVRPMQTVAAVQTPQGLHASLPMSAWGPGLASATQPAPSREVQAKWTRIAQSADNHGRAFAIIDKQQARLWLFDTRGQLVGHTPVLLGAARGDHSVPGIGDRPMAQIQPFERTTPAGRFNAEPGKNMQGEDIFWVDYDAAVSLHRVRAIVASQRRLERLASPTPADNRISYGCINVPVLFYEKQLQPTFTRSGAVVYVLPEDKPASIKTARHEVR